MSDLIISSRRVLTSQGFRDAAVIIKGEMIVDVVGRTEIPKNIHVVDVGNSAVMPGLVDTHVHINEPGRTEWEGFETATKAAAAGGVTTLVDMPLNSSPVTTNSKALQEKISAAEGKLYVDCGFYAGLIPGNAKEIAKLVNAGALGVKAFMIHSGIDEFPNVAESDLRQVLPAIAKTQVPLLVHAELNGNPEIPRQLNHSKKYTDYLASRPKQWENDAIDLLIRLCREFQCKVHIVHLVSSEALAPLREARSAGLPITVETCPHYLFFSSEEIPDGDTRFKCAPPIRESENREQLWAGLKEGIIDFVVSDHSPCPPEMKLPEEGDFMKAWGGISSLQFGLSVVWTEARKRGFSIDAVSAWMSERPAEFAGLNGRKGKIARGYDADLVVWNPEESFVVEPAGIFHRHKVTPYVGRTLFGKVEKTYLRGLKIFEDGKFNKKPQGRVLLRKELIPC